MILLILLIYVNPQLDWLWSATKQSCVVAVECIHKVHIVDINHDSKCGIF